MDPGLIYLSSQVGEMLTQKGLTIATAESCTGGLISHLITEISGSSHYFIGGVVAYSNQIKESLLGVQSNTLTQFGAVSSQTVQEMASGVREKFNAGIGLATTGIAGPTGGTPTKPVGLVWIGISTIDKTWALDSQFTDGRHQVIKKAARKALRLLLNYLLDMTI